jgi:hypothetical protein
MFKIIGGDQRTYGPISAEQVRQWIAEGRANAGTMAQAEGATDWKPLASFPEFADALAAKSLPPLAAPPGGPPPVVTPVNPDVLANEILARDYTLDIGACLSRAWAKIMSDFWPIIGISALVLLLLGVSGATYVAIVVAGPLTAGLYWFYLKLVRGERAEIGDAFAGFSLVFLQSFLGVLVAALLTSIGFLLCIVPGIYLAVSWKLTLPLIIDKRLGFWDAMEVSRKVVSRHWWSFLLFFILCWLINLGGFLLLCIGTFVTAPLTMLALIYAYEDIFGRRTIPGA